MATQAKPERAEGLWTARQTAEFLGVAEKTLRNMRVPRIALPGTGGQRVIVRYDPVQVREWLEVFRSRKTRKATP
jgi:hypothetical protein